MEVIDNWDDIQIKIIEAHINNSIISNEKIIINDELFKEVNKRLSVNVFDTDTNPFASIINTLKYLFFHIRSAIYVKISNNQLQAFIPFANKKYENNWYMNIKLDTGKDLRNNKLHNFIQYRKKIIKKYKKYIQDPKYWWTNASIINNEAWDDSDANGSFVWGQHSFNEYKTLIEETLVHKTVKDCQFFINKRDHPLLNNKLLEPYAVLYPKNKYKLPPRIPDEYYNNTFVPILGPYTNKNYLDIPFVIPEDWNLSNNITNYTINQANIIDWNDKIELAFWRGSGTGSPLFEDNQRLQITKLDNMWKNKGLIDAGIVSWNIKDKVIFDKKLNKPIITFIKIKEMEDYGINLKRRIPMNEQLMYKYILNIDGHSAPNRTSYLLQCGSLILQVESKYVVGDIYWYSHLLKPYVHYVPISFDFTDLEEKINWCRTHDNDCKQIVANAMKFYETHLSRNAIIDYTSGVLNSL
jgi:hypothetical protein